MDIIRIFIKILTCPMKDDIAYVFNGKQFISVRKNEMLNELVDMHIDEINMSLEKNRGKLTEKQVQKLETFLEMLTADYLL